MEVESGVPLHSGTDPVQHSAALQVAIGARGKKRSQHLNSLNPIVRVQPLTSVFSISTGSKGSSSSITTGTSFSFFLDMSNSVYVSPVSGAASCSMVLGSA